MISLGKLKQKINQIAIEEKIPHEVLYQNFFFERFLERLSLSEYKSKMVIKGGFLLSSLLGIEKRSTVDLDFTLASLALKKDYIKKIITTIMAINIEDNCSFKITNVEETRNEDKYEGLRITVLGKFHTLKFHFKIDITTGDIVTPTPVIKDFKLSISEKTIKLVSYNFETVLAEKLQTIISRGVATTRIKDYFDVYAILVNQYEVINYPVLKNAFLNTMNHRNTTYSKPEAESIMNEIISDKKINALWKKYAEEYPFATNLEFSVVFEKVRILILTIIN